MKKQLAHGFAHSALVLLVLVAAVIAFAGYKVANRQTGSPSSSQSSVNTAASNQVPAINTTADLNKAEQTLNDQNIDSDLNPASLNQDVQTLL